MPSRITFLDESFTLDDFGFLDPPGQWSESFAHGMADRLGMVEGLGDDHWKVIRYLRAKYLDESTVPFFVHACIDNGMRIQQFRDLFPTGFLRGACRLAGLSFDFIFSANEALTYETSPPTSSRYPSDVLGFLDRFEDWDEQFALEVARAWRLKGGITPERLEVLRYLRGYYARERSIPLVYETCRALDISLDELSRLFPMGYRRGACLMAGLPLEP